MGVAEKGVPHNQCHHGQRKVFLYNRDKFCLEFVPWNNEDSHPSSEFDGWLCRGWDDAQKKDYFRYNWEELRTKILPGNYGFVVQLNVKRAVERRKPQDIRSVSQLFNPAEFNFSKISHNEILFEIENVTERAHQLSEDSCQEEKTSLVIINVSPLEYGNSLLVPFVNLSLPQVLTYEAVKMGVELVLLSATPAFRVGFNSLCANASVNHLHLHMYYLGHKLLLETVEVAHLAGLCYEICNYPSRGFAFQFSVDDEVVAGAQCVYKVAKFLQSKNLPTNMFITRGSTFGKSPFKRSHAVRVFLWPRKPSYGIKDDTAFNVACCELAGHICMKESKSYETITEDEVCEKLREACLDVFTSVREEVIDLLSA